MSQSSSSFDINALNPQQKIELIGNLWDSLDDSAESLPIPEWHREILDERLADTGAAMQDSSSLDDAMTRLRNRS